MKKRPVFWRAIEIFPGALAWAGLILPVVLSFYLPAAVTIYILVFNLYWLLRAIYMSSCLLRSYNRMKKALRVDYYEKLKNLSSSKDDPTIIDSGEIYHAVLFATYKEELETLLPSVESVVTNVWPNDRKIIALAGEERDRERLERIGGFLKDKFCDRIYDFLVFAHPDGIAGEVRGKGAGLHFAGKKLSEYVAAKKLDEEKIIVYGADADTRFPEQFFACVTMEFVTNPNRHRRSYQPIPLYSNNIWYAPAMSRLTAWGSSFWQMIEASRPWRLVNFSTHCYSLKMLREMDYWAVDVVNEDSRQFWRAYFAFGGDHKAVPIDLPVYLDAVLAENFWTTMKNQYLQKRRWAYGVEHLPYIVTESICHKEIPFWDKSTKTWRLIEGSYSWATVSIYIMFVGWLPFLASPNYHSTVLAYNFPAFSRIILGLAWVGLLISIYISLSFLPPRPRGVRGSRYLVHIADWIVYPISAIFYGSIPALEAQTRLMIGRYLTFWVTPKRQAKRST